MKYDIGIIEKIRKHRAIQSYVRVLPPLLKKRYGNRKRYTEGQVEETAAFVGLINAYIDDACGMYMNRKAFEAMTKTDGRSVDSDEIRREVAENHFDLSPNGTRHDALDAAGNSRGFFGGDSDD